MIEHSALAIANEFIERSIENDHLITQMHAQKFVYLAHGYNLAWSDKPLVSEPIEAWAFGPVVRRLYDALKRYGKLPVDKLICWGDDSPFGFDRVKAPARASLGNSERHLVDSVWNTYRKYTAFQLSALTHEEGTPWKKYFVSGQNNVIPDFEIANYFKGV